MQKTDTINPTSTPNKKFQYIDVSSVSNKSFKVKNTTLIQGNNASSRARKNIKMGDIIFATVRPTLRRIAIISEEFNDQVCSTGYVVLRVNKVIINRFLFYFILTKSFNKKMEKLQRGTSYPAVSDGDIKIELIHFLYHHLIQQDNLCLSAIFPFSY